MSITKEAIIQLARDIFNHKCFPSETGQPRVRHAFRVPDDGEPLGFDYHGVAIEVHVTHLCGEMPVLLILGVAGDGLTHTIAEGVLAHE